VALDDRAGSAGFDNGATTDAIAHTSDGLAIHECCICAGFHSAFAMERAAMTMAYQYDGYHCASFCRVEWGLPQMLRAVVALLGR